MLDVNLKNQLRTYLDRIDQPVQIVATLDDGPRSQELLALLKDIVGLSRLLSLDVSGRDARVPSFSLNRPGESLGVRFAGVPTGHEFSSLVLALLQVGGHPPKVSTEVVERIRALEGPLRFETYFSLSCQNCPDVVQALNQMAALNPAVRHVAIDGALFQDEVEARQVMSVPSLFLNDQPFAQGRMGVEDILAQLEAGTDELKAQKLMARAPYDVLVVGGGPAAAAAAIYAARKGIRTGLVCERFGGQVLDTQSIENFVSVQKTEGVRLAKAMEAHVRQYGVDVISLHRAVALLPSSDPAVPSRVRFANGGELQGRALVLATGARWREMGVPGERDYLGRGVAYCPHCDGPLFKGKRVAVVGGGNSGVEAAIDLAGMVAHVTLLEYESSLRADAVLQRKLFSLDNVEVITGALTSEVRGDQGRVVGLVYKDRHGRDFHTLEVEGVFVQIGLLPNTDWLKGTVELTGRGEVVVDGRCQTSLPGIFAAGDVTTVPYKQIVIAMGEGAKAALAAFDYLIRSSAPPLEARTHAEAAAARSDS